MILWRLPYSWQDYSQGCLRGIRGRSIARGLAAGLMLGTGLAILPLVPLGVLVLAALLIVGGVFLVK